MFVGVSRFSFAVVGVVDFLGVSSFSPPPLTEFRTVFRTILCEGEEGGGTNKERMNYRAFCQC